MVGSDARKALLCAVLPGEASVSVLEALRRDLPPEGWTPSRSALPPLVPLAWLSRVPDDPSLLALGRALPSSLTVTSPLLRDGSWILPVEEAPSLDRARSVVQGLSLRSGTPPIPEMSAFWLGFGAGTEQRRQGPTGHARVGALFLALISFSPDGDFRTSFAWAVERRSWLGRSDE